VDMLQVTNGKVVDAKGSPVRLRGTCVGGWMNLENFINGYPGSEHGIRRAIVNVLGPQKAHFLFSRLLDYFLGEADIAFMRECGATVVRLSLNYRHFERDDEPFTYLEPGFKRLEQAIGWCESRGLYAILDLHSVQGWQNTDWHCDNASRHALFWEHPHFQDRFVALWEEFARRFEGNAAVAGYNVMNEPQTSAPGGRFSDDNPPRWGKLNALYRRVVAAIREIDPHHIIFLEGDNFSSRFDGLDEPFADNLVYSSHNYTRAGFGPGPYPGQIGNQEWNRDKQLAQFQAHEGTNYAQKHKVPLWVGEFGSAYNGPPEEIADRIRALDDQIDVFEELGAHWTTWTYKDVGVMGWVELAPESEYMQLVAPLLETKRLLNADFWMGWLPSTPAKQAVEELARHIEATIEDEDIDPAANLRYLKQATMAGYIAGLMQPTYAKLFRGMSELDIDRVLSSFAFDSCTPNTDLIEVVRKHTARPA
jgi:endoglucanase